MVVHTAPEKIRTHRGSSVTLPCRYHSDAGSGQQRGIRIKWSKDSESLQSTDVLVALGEVQKVFGEFGGRVQLREDTEGDASLIMRNLTLQDDGRYRCEVTDGLQDAQGIVTLSLEGTRSDWGFHWVWSSRPDQTRHPLPAHAPRSSHTPGPSAAVGSSLLSSTMSFHSCYHRYRKYQECHW